MRHTLTRNAGFFEAKHIGSGGQWDVEARTNLQILAIQLRIKVEHQGHMEVWFSDSPSAKIQSPEGWVQIKTRMYSLDHQQVRNIEFSQPVRLLSGQQTSFYMWCGGDDCIFYDMVGENDIRTCKNQHMCINTGDWNNHKGGRWSAGNAKGALAGVVHYDLQFAKNHAEFVQDIGSLLGSEAWSDVDILVGADRARLPAHKVILASRSKVFSAMLQAPMKEATTGEIVLDDLELPLVQELLRFLYTGSLEFREEQSSMGALSLLKVAHRFEVESIVEHCIPIIVSDLAVETAADILIEADAVNCIPLREQCTTYILEHATEVQSTLGFKRLAQTRPQLMLDLFAALVASVRQQHSVDIPSISLEAVAGCISLDV